MNGAPADPMPALRASWQRVWAHWAVTPAPQTFALLIAGYTEPHRHYHTLQHLSECLAQCRDLAGTLEHPEEVEIALWFHDAVYAPRRDDNEALSAQWARRALAGRGVAAAVAQRVHDLVMATRHTAVPAGAHARTLVDIDLSILGAPPERFDEYERQVRAEYAWVAPAEYRRGRRAVLQAFVDRRPLFGTEPMRRSREAQARTNLQRSIAALAD